VSSAAACFDRDEKLKSLVKGTKHLAHCFEGAGILAMNAARVPKFEKLNPPPDPQAQASPEAVQAIGRALGAHYSDLVQAPLPDKLLQLLAKLDDEQSAPTNEGSGNAVG